MQGKKFPLLEKVGDPLVDGSHLPGLFMIGATIVWSVVYRYIALMQSGHAALDGILLLQDPQVTGNLPVYIAITALARFLAVDVKDLEMNSAVMITAAILVLMPAVPVLQYSSFRYSRSPAESGTTATDQPL